MHTLENEIIGSLGIMKITDVTLGSFTKECH